MHYLPFLTMSCAGTLAWYFWQMGDAPILAKHI
jgi:hypothetical protein